MTEICSSSCSDPITSVCARRGLLIVGRATGAVAAYEDLNRALNRVGPWHYTKGGAFRKLRLADDADEGIQGTYTDGRCVYAVVGDVQGKVWDLEDAACPRSISFDRRHTWKTCSLTHSLMHETTVLVLLAGREALCCDLQRSVQGKEESIPMTEDAIPCAFDGERLLVVFQSDQTRLRRVSLWDWATKTLRSTISLAEGRKAVFRAFALLPGVNEMVCIEDNDRISVWDLASGERRRSLVGHRGRIVAFDASPDGRTVSVADDGVVIVWNGDVAEKTLRVLGGTRASMGEGRCGRNGRDVVRRC